MADKSLSLSLSFTNSFKHADLCWNFLIFFIYDIVHIFTFIHDVQCGVCAICAIDTICSSYSYLQLSATAATAEQNKIRRRNTLWNVLNFCLEKNETKTLLQQLNNFLTHCCPWKVHKFAISFHTERQFLLFLTAVKYLYKNRQQLQAKRGDDFAVCRWLMSAHFNR